VFSYRRGGLRLLHIFLISAALEQKKYFVFPGHCLPTVAVMYFENENIKIYFA